MSSKRGKLSPGEFLIAGTLWGIVVILSLLFLIFGGCASKQISYINDSHALFSLEMTDKGMAFCKYYADGRKDCFNHIKEDQHLICIHNGYFLEIMDDLNWCKTYLETE